MHDSKKQIFSKLFGYYSCITILPMPISACKISVVEFTQVSTPWCITVQLCDYPSYANLVLTKVSTPIESLLCTVVYDHLHANPKK